MNGFLNGFFRFKIFFIVFFQFYPMTIISGIGDVANSVDSARGCIERLQSNIHVKRGLSTPDAAYMLECLEEDRKRLEISTSASEKSNSDIQELSLLYADIESLKEKIKKNSLSGRWMRLRALSKKKPPEKSLKKSSRIFIPKVCTKGVKSAQDDVSYDN